MGSVLSITHGGPPLWPGGVPPFRYRACDRDETRGRGLPEEPPSQTHTAAEPVPDYPPRDGSGGFPRRLPDRIPKVGIQPEVGERLLAGRHGVAPLSMPPRAADNQPAWSHHVCASTPEPDASTDREAAELSPLSRSAAYVRCGWEGGPSLPANHRRSRLGKSLPPPSHTLRQAVVGAPEPRGETTREQTGRREATVHHRETFPNTGCVTLG